MFGRFGAGEETACPGSRREPRPDESLSPSEVSRRFRWAFHDCSRLLWPATDDVSVSNDGWPHHDDCPDCCAEAGAHWTHGQRRLLLSDPPDYSAWDLPRHRDWQWSDAGFGTVFLLREAWIAANRRGATLLGIRLWGIFRTVCYLGEEPSPLLALREQGTLDKAIWLDRM